MKKLLAAALVAVVLLAACGSDSSPQVLRVQVSASRDAAAGTKLAAPEGDAASMPVWAGVEYEVDGDLPELDKDAAAWEVPYEKADIDRIESLAEDLGLDGDVDRTEYGWAVVDGSLHLDVQRQAGLPWNLYDEQGGGDVAVSSGVACPAEDTKCVPVEPEEPKRPEGLPSKAEAEKQGRELLEDLGVDLDDAKVQVDDGFSAWIVMVDPEIGGLPVIGMTSAVAIGPEGKVAWANGWLVEPEQGDEYPLIGTKAALKKLRDEQVQILGGVQTGAPEPLIARCDPAASTGIEPATPTVPECVDPGPVEPLVVQITGVHLGLQLFSSWEQGEPAYLVPSYFFETDDGGELPVLGIDEEFLAPPPEPDDKPRPTEPAPEPEPGGTGGGSPGSSGSGSGSVEPSSPDGQPTPMTEVDTVPPDDPDR